jgi:hypothetical protein
LIVERVIERDGVGRLEILVEYYDAEGVNWEMAPI